MCVRRGASASGRSAVCWRERRTGPRHNCRKRAVIPALPRAGYDDASSGESSVITRKCIVSGRVQGVYYRATTANRARELGVTGHAKNLPDGRVEVLAVGEASAVNALVEWLWEGSTASKVTSVEAIEMMLEESERPTRFTTG